MEIGSGTRCGDLESISNPKTLVGNQNQLLVPCSRFSVSDFSAGWSEGRSSPWGRVVVPVLYSVKGQPNQLIWKI